MDPQRRKSYPTAAPVGVPPPPPPPPPPAPPQAHHHHHSQSPVPYYTPSSTINPLGPPPPPHYAHPQGSVPQPKTSPTSPYSTQPPQGPSGASLPPIQQSHRPPASQQESQNLPPFRHPSQSHPHEPPRETHEYHSSPYHSHRRSEQLTPTAASRSYSQDSSTHHAPAPAAAPSMVGPPHPSAALNGGPHPPPPSQAMEQGPYHGYAPAPPPPPNGVPHSIPPPLPQQDMSHYTPHVIDTSGAYSTPPSQPMYSPAHYGAPQSYSVQTMQAKRKHMRATQACEQCRQRKQKCDEGNPCSFCKESEIHCQYRDTPPVKVDKNMEKLLSYMESHSTILQNIGNQFSGFDQRLRYVEQNSWTSNRANAQGEQQSQQTPSQTQPQQQQEDKEKEDEEGAQNAEDATKNPMTDHRTAPQKLLQSWPSVVSLCQAAQVIDLDANYVAEAEDRPILRLYTKGEGIDEYDGTHAGGPASPARSDESSGEMSNLTPPDGIWGNGLPQTPTSEHHGSGGLKPDGSVDLDVNTINTLLDSYMKHIHVMHPFLDKSRLRKIVDGFIKRYSPGQHSLRQKFAVSNGPDGERPLKRQRSNGCTVHDAPSIRREPQIERSPSNAVVWLVLALGKICLHKEALPPIVEPGKPITNNVIAHQLNRAERSPGPVFSMQPPPPPSTTSPSSSIPQSHQSLMAIDGASRRSSADHSGGFRTRNIDVVPGLAYYAKAVEVLGDQGDGNDLIHAQMFLLAGLYKGQLARVKESMSWITMASRAIMNLLDRYKLFNENYWNASGGDVQMRHQAGQARIKDKRHSLIVLASWTALQLESDILAELRLPSSGIQMIENMLLMPHDMSSNEQENYEGLNSDGNVENYDTILLYYTSQLFLRRKLNQVHKEMYSDFSLSQTIDQTQRMLVAHDEILSLWREGLPTHLQWHDNDPPPSEILSARLRAKYWGARYVTNRPFLDYCLHIMPFVSEGRTIEEIAVDANGVSRDKAEVQIFNAIALMRDSEIWRAAKRCIAAAMQSTIAFDGIEGRLWVTNIHGTAHAQFGNMLVLSACYFDRRLRELIDVSHFAALLQRTIRFLRKYGTISRTCQLDAYILEKICRNLFPDADAADAENFYKNEGIVPPTATSSAYSSFERSMNG